MTIDMRREYNSTVRPIAILSSRFDTYSIIMVGCITIPNHLLSFERFRSISFFTELVLHIIVDFLKPCSPEIVGCAYKPEPAAFVM